MICKEFNKLLGLKKGILYSRKPSYQVFEAKERNVADLPTKYVLELYLLTKVLIGEIKELFPQSKTKENAVHAGDSICSSSLQYRRSFGTAETVESYYSQSNNLLPILSEQQILDCTPNTNVSSSISPN